MNVRRTILTLVAGASLAGCGSGLEAGAPTTDRQQSLHAACEDAEQHAVKGHKIAICHIPPGNPANAHTIVVSVNARDAHLAHGDVLGACGCGDIDHPGGGNPDGGGGDYDRPGNGKKNGHPHDADEPDQPDQPDYDDDDFSDGQPGDGDMPDLEQNPGSDPIEPPAGDYGVCDPDQPLCSESAACPTNFACDLGCCVYVIL